MGNSSCVSIVGAGSSSYLVIIVYVLLFAGIFYVLAVRPQRRQRAQHAEMMAAMKKGDEVVTVGGLYGTVRRIGSDWVELQIAPRTKVRFVKRAISSIVSVAEDEEDEYVEEEEEYEEYEETEEAADLEAADEEEYADQSEEEYAAEDEYAEEDESVEEEASDEAAEEPDEQGKPTA